ncbi:MAG: hypothetical protein KGS44_15925 [Alphaproteobacteria bacterium]|nr:hypothetical protein [Alphaproteobacteria bacterium]
MLKFAVSLLGLAALLIGSLIFVVGQEMTAEAFSRILSVAAPGTPRVTGLSGGDIDSGMRFDALLWMT